MDRDSREQPWEAGVWGARAGRCRTKAVGEGRQPGVEAALLRDVGLRLEARDQIFCQRPRIIRVHDSNLYLLLAGPILSISFSAIL